MVVVVGGLVALTLSPPQGVERTLFAGAAGETRRVSKHALSGSA